MLFLSLIHKLVCIRESFIDVVYVTHTTNRNRELNIIINKDVLYMIRNSIK